jgi:CubicO group peptidase (beta-lactamase class C family)
MGSRHVCPAVLLVTLWLGCAGQVLAFPAWVATHGLTSQQYQAWVDKVVADGFRIAYVNGYDGGGTPQFAAIAVQDGLRLWEARHDLTAEKYQQFAKEHAAKGYQPVCLSGYLSGTAPRFATIWVKPARRVPSEPRINLTLQEYRQLIGQEGKRGLRPDCVTCYADGAGSYRFTALFVPRGGAAVLFREDLTPEQFQKFHDRFAPDGYRPTTVTAYPTKNGIRFATVWIKDATKCINRVGLSSDDYQAEFNRNAKDGYVPIAIAGYTEGKAAGSEPFRRAMLKYMGERHIKAGTIAVNREGKMIFQGGFGYADAARKRRVGIMDPFRIASVTKPITAAAVRTLVGEGKLSMDLKVFSYLGLNPPPGKKPDPRLNRITVQHLLDHKGGWDREKSFDPMFRPLEIAAAVGGTGPAGPTDVIRYMMGQPLDFDPGARYCYSNFGFCVLGRVIEKASGQTYVEYIQKKILAPLGIKSVALGRSLPKDRNPREPIYIDPGRGRNVVEPKSKEMVPAPDGTFYLEAMDSHGGLIASAPDLLRFLDAYWISGERRQGTGPEYVFFGSLPGTYTMAMQRPNGVNVVTLFNQRTDPSGRDYGAIEKLMRDIADAQTGGQVRYAAVWVKVP